MIKIQGDNTAYIDIDGTLVIWDKESYTVNQAIVRAIKQHKARGHTVIVWSAGGVEWAERVVKEAQVEQYVDAVMCKPKWYWDDLDASSFMPSTSRYWEKE